MDVEPGTFSFTELSSYVEQAFRPQAEEKGLTLTVALDPKLPPTLVTDAQRLQQILRNLLSNAVKFTDVGTVTLSIDLAEPGMSFSKLARETTHNLGVGALDYANRVVAFTVTDTGVGISADKLSLIFDAFQQADGTTSRRYGGTGLGLSISRQLARLLGGSMVVTSTVGEGSAFTLYLPDLAGSGACPSTVGSVGTTERKPNPIVRGEGQRRIGAQPARCHGPRHR